MALPAIVMAAAMGVAVIVIAGIRRHLGAAVAAVTLIAGAFRVRVAWRSHVLVVVIAEPQPGRSPSWPSGPGVCVGPGVLVAVTVPVTVAVAGVLVGGVPVAVAVAVTVGVDVTVAVGVLVAGVPVTVGDGVAVTVAVARVSGGPPS